MNNKINYQLLLEEIIKNTVSMSIVPTLALHSCCAPCSSYVLEYLSKYFKITVFFYNPNIYPVGEYEQRVSEQKELLRKMKFVHPVEFYEGDYDTQTFETFASLLSSEKEGGSRCFKCYEFRLEKTAQFASSLKFDYFTTTLSISPYKNAEWINQIGEVLSEKYNIEFLPSDFKKKNGYKRSIELSSIYNLYRQNYCGCKYSKRETEKR